MLPTELELLTERLVQGADEALSTARALAGLVQTSSSPISALANVDGLHGAIEILAKELSALKFDAARVRALADAHIDTLRFSFAGTMALVDGLRRESAILGASFTGYEELTEQVGKIQQSIASNFPGPELPGRSCTHEMPPSP